MNLCIIMLGQIRTFFNDGVNSLYPVLYSCLDKYDKVHIILIISGEYPIDHITTFTNYLNCKNITFEIEEFHVSEVDPIIDARIKTDTFICNMTDMIPDYCIKRATYQHYQLKKGIERMINYEKKNNITFDVAMKTRFDLYYPPNFYPWIHPKNASIIDKICLNEENKYFLESKWRDIDRQIAYFKENPWPRDDHSLGGENFNNYISPENIKNGSDHILYMYNDFLIFGNKMDFIKLAGLFDVYGLMDITLPMGRRYSPESQTIMFCFNHDIDPIMYVHGNMFDMVIR